LQFKEGNPTEVLRGYGRIFGFILGGCSLAESLLAYQERKELKNPPWKFVDRHMKKINASAPEVVKHLHDSSWRACPFREHLYKLVPAS